VPDCYLGFAKKKKKREDVI